MRQCDKEHAELDKLRSNGIAAVEDLEDLASKLINEKHELHEACKAVFEWWTETPAFVDGEDEMPAEIFDALRYALNRPGGRES